MHQEGKIQRHDLRKTRWKRNSSSQLQWMGFGWNLQVQVPCPVYDQCIVWEQKMRGRYHESNDRRKVRDDEENEDANEEGLGEHDEANEGPPWRDEWRVRIMNWDKKPENKPKGRPEGKPEDKPEFDQD